MNKKGIELSINFLVIVILSIVILVSSIIIARQLFTGATDIKSTLDDQTDKQLEDMIIGTNKIAIAFNSKTVNQKESTIFGLGVRNILKDHYDFQIGIKSGGAVVDGVMVSKSEIDMEDWQILYDEGVNNIKNNELKKYPISITVGKAKVGSRYIFDVSVEYHDITSDGWKSYGSPEKIYVTVG